MSSIWPCFRLIQIRRIFSYLNGIKRKCVCARALARRVEYIFLFLCWIMAQSHFILVCVCLCGRRLTYGSLYYDLNVVIWRPFARCKLIGCVVIFDITFQAHEDWRSFHGRTRISPNIRGFKILKVRMKNKKQRHRKNKSYFNRKEKKLANDS